jgi:hypothetical protein
MPKYTFSEGKVLVDDSAYQPVALPRPHGFLGGILIIAPPNPVQPKRKRPRQTRRVSRTPC